jgi:hypothetical protein
VKKKQEEESRKQKVESGNWKPESCLPAPGATLELRQWGWKEKDLAGMGKGEKAKCGWGGGCGGERTVQPEMDGAPGASGELDSYIQPAAWKTRTLDLGHLKGHRHDTGTGSRSEG